VRGEAVDAGLREGRAVVPQQLVVRRELRPKNIRQIELIRDGMSTSGKKIPLARAGFGFGLGGRGTYGLVRDDVAADGEAHAGAVPERCGGGACAAAAEDAVPRCG
jgi:hypothetical protein